MAIYQYKCPKCGDEVEILTKTIENEEQEGRLVVLCSKCNEQMEKQIGKIAHWEFKGTMA